MLASISEPNQLTIENFLQLLNNSTQEQLSSNVNSENSEGRSQDDVERVGTDSSPSGGHKQHSKDEASFENWAVFDTRILMDRKETSQYAKKTGKKCARLCSTLIPPFIHEYEETSPSKDKQNKFLNEMMIGQRNNLIDFNSNYPFSVVLFKRLSILEAVFKSLSKKFHCSKVARINKVNTEKLKDKKASQTLMPQSTDVMVHLGVKTGLTLLFSLMKQAWMQKNQSSELCSDVLSTVATVINSLPPLSLANNAKLPKLAKSSLDQVMGFLKDIMKGKVTVDVDGRRMCAEILLGLAVQRGSLLAILDWIETGYKSSLVSDHIYVGKQTIDSWINQMSNSGVSNPVFIV